MATDDEFMAAAQQAATAWATGDLTVDLLAISENAVYRVDTATGERFVLRLHRPGYNTLDEMRSEVGWVQSLSEAGVATSVPRPTIAGDFHVEVPVGDEVRFAGAIEWVDGMPMEAALEADLSTVADRFWRLGSLAAQIRNHAERWDVPDGFTRRHWNLDALLGDEPLWGPFWATPAATDAQRATLKAARDKLRVELAELSADRSRYGLIHADLHLNNVMVEGESSVVIDFDDAGFGWYIHELAVALHSADGEPWYDEARPALIEGYRSENQISDDELSMLDSFVAMRGMMTVGWLTARPELPVHAHLPEVVEHGTAMAERYLSA